MVLVLASVLVFVSVLVLVFVLLTVLVLALVSGVRVLEHSSLHRCTSRETHLGYYPLIEPTGNPLMTA